MVIDPTSGAPAGAPHWVDDPTVSNRNAKMKYLTCLLAVIALLTGCAEDPSLRHTGYYRVGQCPPDAPCLDWGSADTSRNGVVNATGN